MGFWLGELQQPRRLTSVDPVGPKPSIATSNVSGGTVISNV